MKLGILEWNIAALGGRQRTMMVFADFLKSSGYNVKVYSEFSPETEEYNKGNFLDWHNFTDLTPNDFVLDFGLKRRYKEKEIPNELRNLDVLIVPYGGYGYLQSYLPNTHVICWIIHPDQALFSNVREIWTNSKTTKKRLLLTERFKDAEPILRVVYPPHSYKIFRDNAKEWKNRTYDVICIGSLLESKGLSIFDKIVQELNIKGIILATSWERAQEENINILAELKTKTLVNVKSKEVAKYLGDSKVYVSTSYTESSSLAIYESLNAGCVPLVRAVGSEAEQLGVFGHTFINDDVLPKKLSCLLNDGCSTFSVNQGLLFDRVNVGRKILDRIERLD